jgi:hypothetical protein
MNTPGGLGHGAFRCEFDHHVFKVTGAQVGWAQVQIKKRLDGAGFPVNHKVFTGYGLHCFLTWRNKDGFHDDDTQSQNSSTELNVTKSGDNCHNYKLAAHVIRDGAMPDTPKWWCGC